MTHSIDNQALERFRLIRPFLEDGMPLVQLARQHAIALRTLQRWVRRYRSDGMAGLARKRRSDKPYRAVYRRRWWNWLRHWR